VAEAYLTVRWFQGHSIGNRPLLLLGVLLILLGIQFFSTGFMAEHLTNRTQRDRTEAHLPIREEIR